jgi:NAD(P)-dependent dehydrogenase (short-subunit alcohol dehydrogenase family)
MNGTALVTGAGGGIGLATVRCLVKDGLDVVASDVKDAVPDLPAEATYVPFDLLDGNPATLLATFEGTGLDYLVNAAGVAMFDRDGSVLDIGEAVWDLTLGVNLHGLRRLTAAAVPHLRKGSGKSIVNVASIAGIRGMDSPLDAYQVSKAAVVSLTRTLALQLGADGIRCNTVCPGAILTPMIAPLYSEDPERRVDMERRTPLGRLGLPEDIAHAIRFLLSDDASFITATDLVVDGGWTAQIK